MPKDATVEYHHYNGEPYLTKTALRKELKLSNKKLEKVVNLDGGIKCRTVTNAYRSFAVYCLEDVKSLFNLT
jgi:hypothetical protein